jgi:hypothetical protein
MTRELHIPHLDLDLAGVDPETARQVIELLPAALERALNPEQRDARGAQPVAPGLAQGLADKAAGQVARQVQNRRREA